ncbi:MAG: hypothetical protein IKY52_09760, partial [Clostridia bacterium]|nr:hypothetical protein [Clostridia bacterium]
MKKYFTRTITIMLLLSLLTSCGAAVTETSADTIAAETETTPAETDDSWRETSDEIGDITFDGRTYTVLFRDIPHCLREVTAEELTGDVIN